MVYLTKEAFLQAQEPETEDVAIPRLGGSVRVKVMNCVERAVWDHEISASANSNGDIPKDLRSLLASLTVVDEKGQRLFSSEDVEALSQKDYLLIDPIVDVALRINKLLPGAMEEERKNLSRIPASDSPTG